ncbi:MAG: transporter ATP-binding protein, partial [Phycisphaerales bacterium]|nr:transporter ATP-binding protein [Phycisphaerales bacterium]
TMVGQTADVISEYLRQVGDAAGEQIYAAAPLPDKPKITRVELRTSEPNNVQMNGRPMEVHIELTTPVPINGARLSFHACNTMQEPILYFWCHDTEHPMAREAGTYHLVCRVPNMRMFMGDYTLRVHLKEQAGGKEFEVLEGICPFEVVMYGRDREGGWHKNTCAYLEEGNWEVSKVG